MGAKLYLEWLYGKYQKNLLEVFFNNPTNSYNVRELARQGNVDPGNTKRYVEKFAKIGILNLQRHNRALLSKPNYDNLKVRKLFEIFEVDRTYQFMETDRSLKETIKSLTNMLKEKENVLFMSLCCYSRNGESANSDLELLVVKAQSQSDEALEKAIAKNLEDNKIKLQIKPYIIDSETFETSVKSDKNFLNDFWKERVVLFGEGYLWRMITKRGLSMEAETKKEMKA